MRMRASRVCIQRTKKPAARWRGRLFPAGDKLRRRRRTPSSLLLETSTSHHGSIRYVTLSRAVMTALVSVCVYRYSRSSGAPPTDAGVGANVAVQTAY